ncbi:MAG: bL28 family ribosomal protein [Candidatus Dojkabacteria bacterium]|nr:bL28 family ribosomal protein [Candidatus Dojkabacteria bacterium]MDQ7021774.1 bL28 family ribosomal protein [Candidatus Dojkabacteria bacterium]
MARKCEITGKSTSFGNSKKHRRGKSGAGGTWRFKAPKTRRTWRPNLRKVKLEINGVTKRVKISMKAYKKLRKLQEAQ